MLAVIIIHFNMVFAQSKKDFRPQFSSSVSIKTDDHTAYLQRLKIETMMIQKKSQESKTLQQEAIPGSEQIRKNDSPGFDEDKKKKTDGCYDFTVGALFSNKSGEYPKYDPLLGLQFGVQTQLMSLSDEIGIGLGAVYSMQGGKYESSDYVPGGDYNSQTKKSRLNYLNFPIVAQYQKEKTGFFAEAGVQPGILLSAKEKEATTTDIKDEVRKFDLGIPLGLGYRFRNNIGVGLRFTPGLLNVNKEEQFKNKNMVASLRLLYHP